MKKPSKNVQEVINIEQREINLHQIRIGSVDKKVVLYYMWVKTDIARLGYDNWISQKQLYKWKKCIVQGIQEN